jgi:hypothetical protein
VNVQQSTDFAVEVDFTTLNVAAKQGALAYFENRAGHPKAVGMKQPSNANAITNIELSHPEIIL